MYDSTDAGPITTCSLLVDLLVMIILLTHASLSAKSSVPFQQSEMNKSNKDLLSGQSLHEAKHCRNTASTTETNRIHLVLFDMHTRTSHPYLAWPTHHQQQAYKADLYGLQRHCQPCIAKTAPPDHPHFRVALSTMADDMYGQTEHTGLVNHASAHDTSVLSPNCQPSEGRGGGGDAHGPLSPIQAAERKTKQRSESSNGTTRWDGQSTEDKLCNMHP
jgi:hypothetical protein